MSVVFQLTVVTERIMAFSLASSLAKFLNGLEILLSKAQVSSVSKMLNNVSCMFTIVYFRVVWSVYTSRLENKSETILTADTNNHIKILQI